MITEQVYIPQLVRCFEEEGVVPVPIFINGIEAHTVVCCRLLLSYQYSHCFSCMDSIPSVPACDLGSLNISLQQEHLQAKRMTAQFYCSCQMLSW